MRTACVYGCELNGSMSTADLDAELREFIHVSVAYGEKDVFCPRQWMHRSNGNNCERLMPNPAHVPIQPAEIGRVVALFRHPRSRVASSCRQWAPEGDGFTDKWFASCIADHFRRHNSVQTRLVAGESCGGATDCNGVAPLPAVQTEMVRKALDRMPSAFLFIGLTDEWDASIELFHLRLTPHVPVLPAELLVGHASPGDANNQSHANQSSYASESTLERQERVAASLYHHHIWQDARDAMELDPDLLLYARARALFCRDYESRSPPVSRRVPKECGRTLGATPVGDDGWQQSVAARVVGRWSAKWALLPVVAGSPASAAAGAVADASAIGWLNGAPTPPPPPRQTFHFSPESIERLHESTFGRLPKVGDSRAAHAPTLGVNLSRLSTSLDRTQPHRPRK